MRDETTWRLDMVPARVLLHGGPDAWSYVVVGEDGSEDHIRLPGVGTRWHPSITDATEPPWWRNHLAEMAEDLRDHISMTLTDQCFETLGCEAQIAWFALDEPTGWEGAVVLREADPARFPGRVPPFLMTPRPDGGVLLPGWDLRFDMPAAEAWETLAAVARQCGTPPPKYSFVCGWADHRSIRIGRGRLGMATSRTGDGPDHIREIYATRPAGWAGNPELQFRFDGIDLLGEPADDVTYLLTELGHDLTGSALTIPSARLTLTVTESRITRVTLHPTP